MITALLTTLMPALLGLLTSALPNFVEILQKRQDYKHEIELIKMKMEAASAGLDHQLIVESARAAVEEGKSLREHDLTLNDNSFINTVRASVRPVITYVFFFLFIGVKITAGAIMVVNNEPGIAILAAIWDVSTISIFMAIVGFWFGSRSLMHFATNYRNDK